MLVGGRVQGGGWGKGGKWDNCNSIIDKIYLKEKKHGNDTELGI